MKFYTNESKLVLENWFLSHQNNPYPTDEEKENLSIKSNLTIQQVSAWMKNARRIADTKISEKNRIKTENKLILLKHFRKNQDPNKKIIDNIAKETGLNDKRIKAWFRYQRFLQKDIKD